MMTAIHHFLLVFDHAQDKLIRQENFGADAAAATQRYGELERYYRHESLIDIVLVGSDSIETVRVTHANYFDGMSRQKVDDILKGALA